MKRKAILLAGKTFVVSLPNKWAKTWGVKKGEELEVAENGPNLTISTQKSKYNKKITLDLSKNSERVVRWVLSSLDKKGYDEIELENITPQQVEIIKELTKDLFVGFTIIQHHQKSLVLGKIAKDEKENYEQVLRRVFLITLNSINVYSQSFTVYVILN